MTREAIIKLENVWKIYQLGETEVSALSGVSLEILEGSFVSIMGPSGSGKSTLLNMIGCLDVPTKGKVFLEDKDIALLSENELAFLRGKTIGFVFQEFNILPNLTALENVTLPMIFQGVTPQERKRRAEKLLSSVGLADRMFHRPAQLSAGQRQRVAIARAFGNDPKLVIADEPTGNLDSWTGKKVMEILTDFHQKKGKTIVVVTHDANIANYSEKTISFQDGQIITNHQQASKVLWSE